MQLEEDIEERKKNIRKWKSKEKTPQPMTCKTCKKKNKEYKETEEKDRLEFRSAIVQ